VEGSGGSAKATSFPVVFPDGVYWMVVVRRCLLDGISSKVFFSPVENLLATWGVGVIDPVTPRAKLLTGVEIPLGDDDPLRGNGGVSSCVRTGSSAGVATNPIKVLGGGRCLLSRRDKNVR
jgi:hypothetical protein